MFIRKKYLLFWCSHSLNLIQSSFRWTNNTRTNNRHFERRGGDVFSLTKMEMCSLSTSEKINLRTRTENEEWETVWCPKWNCKWRLHQWVQRQRQWIPFSICIQSTIPRSHRKEACLRCKYAVTYNTQKPVPSMKKGDGLNRANRETTIKRGMFDFNRSYYVTLDNGIFDLNIYCVRKRM